MYGIASTLNGFFCFLFFLVQERFVCVCVCLLFQHLPVPVREVNKCWCGWLVSERMDDVMAKKFKTIGTIAYGSYVVIYFLAAF